jgi:hypothetical protein
LGAWSRFLSWQIRSRIQGGVIPVKIVELETPTAEIEATFDQFGFKRAYYDPFHRALTTSTNALPAWNALFVRDWEFVTHRLTSAPAVKVLGRSV